MKLSNIGKALPWVTWPTGSFFTLYLQHHLYTVIEMYLVKWFSIVSLGIIIYGETCLIFKFFSKCPRSTACLHLQKSQQKHNLVTRHSWGRDRCTNTQPFQIIICSAWKVMWLSRHVPQFCEWVCPDIPSLTRQHLALRLTKTKFSIFNNWKFHFFFL